MRPVFLRESKLVTRDSVGGATSPVRCHADTSDPSTALGASGDWISTGVSSSAKIRSDEAIAPCSTLNFSDMSLIGLKKRDEYCRKATSEPSVTRCCSTHPPPTQMIS